MSEPEKPQPPKRPRGRPPTRVVKLDATPEQAARNIFAAAKPPDPKKQRKPKRRRVAPS